jgi:DNA polymerase-3 subunit alpha
VVKPDLGKIETLSQGNCVLVGIIKSIKIITTAKGAKMAFTTLADYNGEIEAVFFTGAWEKCQSKIETDTIAILKGKIDYQKDKDRYSFVAEDWVSPEDAEAAAAQADAQARKWDKYRNVWQYKADLKLSNPASAAKGTYTIAGFLTSLREITDKKGNPMAFGVLKDFEGEIELVFFASMWKECRELLTVDEFVVLKGSIDPANDKNPEKPSFKVSSLPDLTRLMRAAAKENAADAENGQKNACREVHIRLSEAAVRQETDLYPLRDRLAENPGPCVVFLHVPVSGREAVIRAAARMSAEDARFEALAACAGVAGAWRV